MFLFCNFYQTFRIMEIKWRQGGMDSWWAFVLIGGVWNCENAVFRVCHNKRSGWFSWVWCETLLELALRIAALIHPSVLRWTRQSSAVVSDFSSTAMSLEHTLTLLYCTYNLFSLSYFHPLLCVPFILFYTSFLFSGSVWESFPSSQNVISAATAIS